MNLIYSGLATIHLQDQAMTESMGLISDHGYEHLGPGDLMIAKTRRRLLQAARAWCDHGTVPPGLDDPDVFLGTRSGRFLVPSAAAFPAVYEERLTGVVRPAVSRQAAEQGGRSMVPSQIFSGRDARRHVGRAAGLNAA